MHIIRLRQEWANDAPLREGSGKMQHRKSSVLSFVRGGRGKRCFKCRIQPPVGEGADRGAGSRNSRAGVNASHDSGSCSRGWAAGDAGSPGGAGGSPPRRRRRLQASASEVGRRAPRDGPTRLHPAPRPRTYRGTRSGRCSGPERLGPWSCWSCPAGSYPGCPAATSSRWGPPPAAAGLPSPFPLGTHTPALTACGRLPHVGSRGRGRRERDRRPGPAPGRLTTYVAGPSATSQVHPPIRGWNGRDVRRRASHHSPACWLVPAFFMETQKGVASGYAKSFALRRFRVCATAHAWGRQPGSGGLSRGGARGEWWDVGFWKNWEAAQDGAGSGEERKTPSKPEVPMQPTGRFRFTVSKTRNYMSKFNAWMLLARLTYFNLLGSLSSWIISSDSWEV